MGGLGGIQAKTHRDRWWIAALSEVRGSDVTWHEMMAGLVSHRLGKH
jgi:hypothetical protein